MVDLYYEENSNENEVCEIINFKEQVENPFEGGFKWDAESSTSESMNYEIEEDDKDLWDVDY